MRYGICKCGKWGDAPAGFKEKTEFLLCTCNEFMYLQHMNPKEAGYKEKDKIQPRRAMQP